MYIDFSGSGFHTGGGSDDASFICYGVPSFSLGGQGWDYGNSTWHTNRDSFDKIVFDDLRNNATLVAMLAYAASEDPEHTSRERAILPPNPDTGEPRAWPTCGTARRAYER